MANKIPDDKDFFRINFKPSFEFDKKYNTNLSTEWDIFPRGLKLESLWELFISNKELYKIIATELKYEHFPYDGIDSLTINQKNDILQGMLSGLNYIVHYSIKGIYGYMNTDVVNTTIKLYGNIVERDVQWVMSPQTLNKLKKELVW